MRAPLNNIRLLIANVKSEQKLSTLILQSFYYEFFLFQKKKKITNLMIKLEILLVLNDYGRAKR